MPRPRRMRFRAGLAAVQRRAETHQNNKYQTNDEGGSCMQAVIAIPDLETAHRLNGGRQILMEPVCGIPLLVRVIQTAVRAGAESVVLIWRSSQPISVWMDCLEALRRVGIQGVQLV